MGSFLKSVPSISLVLLLPWALAAEEKPLPIADAPAAIEETGAPTRIAEACGIKNDAMAYSVSRRFVMQRLAMPFAAKFPAAHETQITAIADCRYRVFGYFDTHSSIGAFVRSRYVAELMLQPDTRNWILISVDIGR
jgi:hypothetical protein